MSKKIISSILFVFICCSTSFVTAESPTTRSRKIRAPSASFPTIQRGIDAAVDGDTVVIKPGVYFETLRIEGKSITLKGSGSSGDRRTEIVGQRPGEIVPLERAIGCIHYGPGGGGELKNLLLRYADAGIVGEKRDALLPAPLTLKNLTIQEGTRGILGSFSNLTLKKTTITKTGWNGISLVEGGEFKVKNSSILETFGVGLFITNNDPQPGAIFVEDSVIALNTNGGILIVGHAHPIVIVDCEVNGNAYAGIRLMDVGNALIFQTEASFNIPRLSDGKFGDGLVVWSSELVSVNQSNFEENTRAGTSNFGCDPTDPSFIEIANTHFENNDFELAGGGWDIPLQVECDTGFHFTDLGGNTCIRNNIALACQVLSPGLEAPDAVTEMP